MLTMKSSVAERAVEPVGVGRRHRRVAGDGDERAHLAVAGRLDLLGEHDDRELAEELGQAAHADVRRPKRHAPALARSRRRVGAAGRGLREHRAAGSVEVAGAAR